MNKLLIDFICKNVSWQHCVYTKHKMKILVYVLLMCIFTACVNCKYVNKLERVNHYKNKGKVRFGYLSFFRGFGIGKEISGAIPLAVEQVNRSEEFILELSTAHHFIALICHLFWYLHRDPRLLPNHTLEFIAADEGPPNTATSIKRMIEMKQRKAIAFIGPENTCISEALLATAWNFPMITYVSCNHFYLFNHPLFQCSCFYPKQDLTKF